MITRPAFDPERAAKMLEHLRTGATLRDSARGAGIAWSTWNSWAALVRRGECDDLDVKRFVENVYETFHRVNVELNGQIRLASIDTKKRPGDWRAAAWLLDKRQGDPYARSLARKAKWEAEIARAKAQGTHVDTVRVAGMSDDEIMRRAREIMDELNSDESRRETH